MVIRKKLVLLASGLAILVLCFVTAAQKTESRVMKGVPVAVEPKVEAIDTDRLKQLLKRDSQKPLLVNFWATWCDPCRDEFPDLVKVDADYRAKGLDFIAVTLDDLADINTEVPKFLRTMHAQMPAYLLNVADPEPAITYVDPKWGGALPATFLYDGQGQVVYKTFGRVKVPELRAAIDKVINKVQGPTSTPGSPMSKVQGPRSAIDD